MFLFSKHEIFWHIAVVTRLSHSAREGSMAYKLRKLIFSVAFWVGIFAAIVVFNAIWALTHQ